MSLLRELVGGAALAARALVQEILHGDCARKVEDAMRECDEVRRDLGGQLDALDARLLRTDREWRLAAENQRTAEDVAKCRQRLIEELTKEREALKARAYKAELAQLNKERP